MIVTAMLTSPSGLLIALMFVSLALVLSGVSPTPIFGRYAVAVPFIAFASASMYMSSGLENAILLFSRITTGVFCLFLITETTPFIRLLEGLRSYKVPEILLLQLFFLERFIHIVLDEFNSTTQARKARAHRNGRHLMDMHSLNIVAASAGHSIARTHARGKDVYDALVTRGFRGTFNTTKTMNTKPLDVAFASSMVIFSVFLIIMDKGWY